MIAIAGIDAMRAEIAAILHEGPAEIGDEDNLMDLGLDSMRAMTLVQRWQDRGLKVEFAAFAEVPTLAHWWAVASRAQGLP